MIKFFNWIKRVIIGWRNVLTGNETPEARKRYEICMQCDDKIKVGKDYICGHCGCFLKAKTRSPEEECLLNKW